MKKTKLILNSLLVLSVCVGCSSANGVAMASLDMNIVTF